MAEGFDKMICGKIISERLGKNRFVGNRGSRS